MSLITLVKTELLARKGEWPRICSETGVSYWWLTKFAQGRIDNPGVLVLEKLQKHFEADPRQQQVAEASLVSPAKQNA
ncbi:hypothetical protein [Burkholderia ubonensis]|uniref:hypothetical protein n=1 Tax=Burkholderia ubonensis TaxID=101571 RepID=UPI00075784CD|nr:hypothetical protein [Burkholderia ubonensis]AOI70857.1 hypothetical protein WI31_15665 [Burkholderia ubonensis]KUZ07402.1 hypothetical protein WI29_34120 [Burkholderia ubonensis]KUZ20642.1 hypothetical protein WI30_01305 [Burkholderia ubonensis]KUZ33364.1 hypothetical protein WI32_19745 [Burkholderia ubonensis]KUZ44783.1 hypothetical protein WI33_27970 [Burkholderia ubonensis]